MRPKSNGDTPTLEHRPDRPISPAAIIDLCRARGVELFEGKKLVRIRVQSRDPLPPDLRTLIRDNKEAILEFLFAPATPEELDTVAQTGRRPSPLLTRAQARELALLGSLSFRPLTPWDWIIDDYQPAREWQRRPASAKQLSYLHT